MSSCRAISAQNGSWRVEIAEHEAAAVEEEEERPGVARLARIVEPKRGSRPPGPGQERSRITASSPAGASATWRAASIMLRASTGPASWLFGPGKAFR